MTALVDYAQGQPGATVAITLVVGYLLGSIPFGLILTRAAGLGDIRRIGSGNIGATNVLRTGNRTLAAATLLLDGLKGTAAVVLVGMVSPPLALLAGLAAFVGHLFPLWLHFKGGKGVATYIGVLLAVSQPAVIVFAVLWLGTAKITKYSSLGALVATALTPLALLIWQRYDAALLFVVMTVLVWLRHHANIRRLLDGTEGRIGQKG